MGGAISMVKKTAEYGVPSAARGSLPMTCVAHRHTKNCG
jgi:hypothetical protein